MTPISQTLVTSPLPPAQPDNAALIVELRKRLIHVRKTNEQLMEIKAEFSRQLPLLKTTVIAGLKEEVDIYARRLFLTIKGNESLETDIKNAGEQYSKDHTNAVKHQQEQKEKLAFLQRKIEAVGNALQCPVCKVISASQILMGPCGHSVCRDCVSQGIEKKLAKAYKLLKERKCPQCSQDRLLPGTEIVAAKAIAIELGKIYGKKVNEHTAGFSAAEKEFHELTQQNNALIQIGQLSVKKFLSEAKDDMFKVGFFVHFKQEAPRLLFETYQKGLSAHKFDNKPCKLTFNPSQRMIGVNLPDYHDKTSQQPKEKVIVDQYGNYKIEAIAQKK